MVVLVDVPEVRRRYPEVPEPVAAAAVELVARVWDHVLAGRRTEALSSMARDLTAYPGDRTAFAPLQLHHIAAAMHRHGPDRVAEVMCRLGLARESEPDAAG